MGVAGLQPDPVPQPSTRVPRERLAEFDRLMKEGGIEAITQELEKKRMAEVQ
jgi:hypothetical protein